MKIPKWLPVYGDTTFRGECPTESAEQVTFFNRLRAQYPESFGRIATHIKNEGKRSQNQAQRDRMQGLTKGASDIVIPANPAFICELKKRDHTKSKWQSGQQEYLKSAHDLGAFVCLALGVEGAWQAFEEYLQKYYK